MDLRVSGFLLDGDALDLPGLMRKLLTGIEKGSTKTWAQRLIEAWIVDALEGSPRAIEEILAECKANLEVGNATATGSSSIDDVAAAKVLEVLCGSGCEATCA